MFAWKRWFFLSGAGLGLAGMTALSAYADNLDYSIKIENHQFSPRELEIPAGVKVKIIIENLDKTSEEFESYELNREKMIAGTKKATIFLGPLKPGTYKYFGEFHPSTAQGIITVKE
jgi:plastocyanin